MRLLVLGLDGADYDLVCELLSRGKLPTLGRVAGAGSFGPLRSTIPAVTPTAWSSFLTGLNPGGHGIFNFSTNPNRDRQRLESAASRSGAPFWRTLGTAGIRSAFVTVPFTYPPDPIDGIVVTGYGGPEPPAIEPASARSRILAAHPGLVTARHPMTERWWEDFERYSARLVEHVDEIGDVCRLVLELEPQLGLLCVDFMDSDHAGHLGYHRLDPEHPAHRPDAAGDELVRVYEAVDRVCGELLEEATARWGEEPTTIILSDHGMKPIYWKFHANRWLEEAGLLRYRRRSLQPYKRGRLRRAAAVDSRLARTRRRWAQALDHVPGLPEPAAERTFADIDFGSTRAYCFATGGQLYLGEASGAVRDAAFRDELAEALRAVRHPETEEPAFDVLTKDELYRGRNLAKAPELVLLPRDERVYVDSSRRSWERPFERLESLDPEISYGYSGHHSVTGIIAAAGPGLRPAEIPDGTDITQLPATILRLFGLQAGGLDGEPLETLLEERPVTEVGAAGSASAPPERVYTEAEEAEMLARLRDLGYE